jgi:hypothetical protein
MPAGADKDRLTKSLDFYGKAGEKNGVTVAFSANVQQGQAKLGPDGFSVTVTLNDEFYKFGSGWESEGVVRADVLASTLAHEGSHGIDARAVRHDPRNKAEALTTERRAYRVTSKVHETLGSRAIPKVWDPKWPAASAERLRAEVIEEAAQNSASGWDAQ